MNAIILAAGIGRRLAPLTDRTQKCLIRVGGRPILIRMLEALEAAGIAEAILVVGHSADQVRAAARRRFGRMAIRYIDNSAYTKGSVLSLHAAREWLREPVLVMDADVVFPREFIPRLLAAPAPSALLLDRNFRDSGDEVKVYTRGERVIAVGTKVVPEAWEGVGEAVGFFKCGAEAGRALLGYVETVIAEGSGLNEYEDALHLLVTHHHVGWVDVTGLPWIEIDFPEDLRRAEAEVLPRLVQP